MSKLSDRDERTYIDGDNNMARTVIRGGGYGSSAWIAKITGTHPKFKFEREFCDKDTSGMSGSGRSGVIEFELDGPGLYEFRGFCVGSTANNWEWSNFALIDDDGDVEEMTRKEALAWLVEQEQNEQVAA